MLSYVGLLLFPFSKQKNCDNISRDDRRYNLNVSLKHKLKDDDLPIVFDYVFLPLVSNSSQTLYWCRQDMM